MINFEKSALLEIDVQNDFCPGGALGVKGGNEVTDPLNRLAFLFAGNGARVVATQDWHPVNHVSFASSHPGMKQGDTIDLPTVKDQVLWPDHCIQGTPGAAFHKSLDLDLVHLVVRKGFRGCLDSYSAFFENDRATPTGLEGFLKGLSIDTVYIGGLATDYCVFYSAMDAVNCGLKTYLIIDAVRGVHYPAGSVEKAIEVLRGMGVVLIESGEVL